MKSSTPFDYSVILQVTQDFKLVTEKVGSLLNLLKNVKNIFFNSTHYVVIKYLLSDGENRISIIIIGDK